MLRFSCQARSKLETIVELRLQGLGKLTGNEKYTHELTIPVNKQGAFKYALQLIPQFKTVTDPTQPLRSSILLAITCLPCQPGYRKPCLEVAAREQQPRSAAVSLAEG